MNSRISNFTAPTAPFIAALCVIFCTSARAVESNALTLENARVRLAFDAQGRLTDLADGAGRVKAPIDRAALTEPWVIDLRSPAGDVSRVAPQTAPTIERRGDALICAWSVTVPAGRLAVRAKVELRAGEPLSEWTLEVDNETDSALWQIHYPRISGLTAFAGNDGPDWLAVPFHMGEITPNPVADVNGPPHKPAQADRAEYRFDSEGSPSDMAYSYPGMLTMQFLAYGHPAGGGVYFGAHDPQALYKKFGLYADGGDGRHAALVLKQYPKDRTAPRGKFASLFPATVGVYAGDWWGASALYRPWALQQQWSKRGPTRDRADIPPWTKALDLWYWNWQFPTVGQPDRIVPAMEYLKKRFGCELAFHWYGCNGEAFGSGWRTPEEFPDNEDIRATLLRGVRRLHASGIHCIPYINGRLWNPNTASFKAADGLKWAVTDAEGKAAREWDWLGYTICPTAAPYQQLIARVTNQMIDGCEMDGAYLDQISSAYSIPCFSPAHNHAPGGHDHWTRGYREMLERVQGEIKRRSPDNVITSESVIEGYLDLFDLDLAREISNLKGHLGNPALLPIPMFHSVYHDYHMTYGTVQTFKETDLARFRFGEALCLVGGGQLMISGFFPGDEKKEKFKPHLDFMEALTKAHVAGRRWLNLGVWKPPLDVQCDRVEVPFSATDPPKKNLPAILNGCFELDGELCIVLVNHTAEPRQGRVRLDPRTHGLAGAAFRLDALTPLATGDFSNPLEWRVNLPAASAHTLILRPRP